MELYPRQSYTLTLSPISSDQQTALTTERDRFGQLDDRAVDVAGEAAEPRRGQAAHAEQRQPCGSP